MHFYNLNQFHWKMTKYNIILSSTKVDRWDKRMLSFSSCCYVMPLASLETYKCCSTALVIIGTATSWQSGKFHCPVWGSSFSWRRVHLDRKGIHDRRFTNNLPGQDCLKNFSRRHQFVNRMADNIAHSSRNICWRHHAIHCQPQEHCAWCSNGQHIQLRRDEFHVRSRCIEDCMSLINGPSRYCNRWQTE